MIGQLITGIVIVFVVVALTIIIVLISIILSNLLAIGFLYFALRMPFLRDKVIEGICNNISRQNTFELFYQQYYKSKQCSYPRSPASIFKYVAYDCYYDVKVIWQKIYIGNNGKKSTYESRHDKTYNRVFYVILNEPIFDKIFNRLHSVNSSIGEKGESTKNEPNP